MTARIPYAACLVVLFTAAAAAQQAPSPPPRPAPPAKPAPAPATPQPAPAARVAQPRDAIDPRNQAINIKVDVTITEQRGKAEPNRKVVSIIAADGFRNAIRSQETFFPPMVVPLNVDVTPFIIDNSGKIRLQLNLEYDLPGAQVKAGSGSDTERFITKSEIRENLWLILENGKPIVAAQSADPVSDRQVTVEVRATILK